MYVLMRIVSLVLVVVALMLLGADAVSSLEHHGEIAVRSIETVWGMFDPASVAAFKGWTNGSLPGFLAGAILSLLSIPGWALSGVLGVTLAFIFGRHHEEA
ncbi:MAG: hypothetical protein KGJ78_08995 [Alphaproteobacteria bacterium]|nr:hypothetical protein [Alphaproteobacteria bacterium]